MNQLHDIRTVTLYVRGLTMDYGMGIRGTG